MAWCGMFQLQVVSLLCKKQSLSGASSNSLLVSLLQDKYILCYHFPVYICWTYVVTLQTTALTTSPMKKLKFITWTIYFPDLAVTWQDPSVNQLNLIGLYRLNKDFLFYLILSYPCSTHTGLIRTGRSLRVWHDALPLWWLGIFYMHYHKTW